VPRPVIFLSYRRDDVPFAVGLLAARLFEAFPPGDVFLDTMANRRGLFVRRRLDQALARSAVVVSVMGPVWDDERHLSRLAGRIWLRSPPTHGDGGHTAFALEIAG
jgi:hypothetical protein